MQKLVFEEAWDRTIAQNDRVEIEHIFHEAVANLDTGVTFTSIWNASNHKNEQLVTAIVHNKTTQMLVFDNTTLEFWGEDQLLAEYTSTLPTLKIPPETSIPWTFIFPAKSFTFPDSVEHTKLRLKKEK